MDSLLLLLALFLLLSVHDLATARFGDNRDRWTPGGGADDRW